MLELLLKPSISYYRTNVQIQIWEGFIRLLGDFLLNWGIILQYQDQTRVLLVMFIYHQNPGDHACIQILIESMDFYELQQQRIADDQKDNQLIETLTKNYASLKLQYETTYHTNLTLTQQLAQLKEQNQQLQREIAQLKSAQKLQDNEHAKAQLFIDNQTTNFYRSGISMTPVAFRTVDRSMCSQLTKRRVINSFAEELTLELQQSEQTLYKERKMHEQTRKALQLCNEEMSTWKIKAKDLQNRVLSLTIENQKLIIELDGAIKDKRGLQEHYQMRMKEKNQKHRNLLLNLQEFEEEMSKMDYIYGNIEHELSLKT